MPLWAHRLRLLLPVSISIDAGRFGWHLMGQLVVALYGDAAQDILCVDNFVRLAD